jgi:hypothetical protein
MPQPSLTFLLFITGATFSSFFLVLAPEAYLDCDAGKRERSHSAIPEPPPRVHPVSAREHKMTLTRKTSSTVWGGRKMEREKPGLVRAHQSQKRGDLRVPPGSPWHDAVALHATPGARREWARAIRGKLARMILKYPEAVCSMRFGSRVPSSGCKPGRRRVQMGASYSIYRPRKQRKQPSGCSDS